MKTIGSVLALTVSTVCNMQAQVAPSLATNALGPETSLSASNAIVQSIIEAMPQTTQTFDPASVAMRAQETNLSSQVIAQSVVEAGASITRRRAAISEEIELLPEGAIARFGPHRVAFPPNTAEAIQLWTPEGLRLENRVLGLCYLSEDGESVMLGEVKATEGELVPPNRVIYRDAFDGGVSADIMYEYTRSSFEQWIVIRKRLPSTPSDHGFSQPEKVRLAVLTEFINPPEPRKVVGRLSLGGHYQALGISADESLTDETLIFGSMRMVPGKSFTLGEPELSVPVGKTWEVLLGPQGEPRQFLVESTPYALIKPQLDSLPLKTAMHAPRKAQKIQTALLQLKPPSARTPSPTLMAKAQTRIDAEPGVVLDYLIVNNASINVDFAGNAKTGFAAIGQTEDDYWNSYVQPGSSSGTLLNLLWSNEIESPVDLIVANAPGQWGNPFCVDSMYNSYIYPWNAGHVTVTITNLPADTYDFYVYATRATALSPGREFMMEFKRAGATLWTKGTTIWGNGWYSTYWDEGEQYVRFRNITVSNQPIVLDVFPDAAGYAAISGLQIVPSSAIPSEQPVITKLLNVNFGGNTADKVGFAAVGLTTNDYWTGYVYSWAYAATVPDLKWSDQTTSPADMTVWNAPGSWGNSLPDPMFRSYKYALNGGNITITLTDLPAGICDVYLYGHIPNPDDNAVFELWSDDVNWGIKGTSLIGTGPTAAAWEVGQQYVRFKDVTVSAGKPVIIQAKHTKYGYNNLSGMQIAYTGEVDTDADGVPDGWERRSFNNLAQTANGDADGLTNLREYQLGTDPTRSDSNANGITDLNDAETVWLEDTTPQGSYEDGYLEGWNWFDYWYDGDGWGGNEIYPYSGGSMHVSDLVSGDMHQHYFDRSLAVIRPGAGDVLYAYVNLDSTYPPSEVMLQFYTMETNGYGSWEHRAYWGANNLNYGVDGTASRYYMGPLPTAGQWVRLEVPASAVGLEGKIVEGMAYTLYGGRAAWDSAGTMKPDHEGDGLLDAWEIQYFGNLLQTAAGDADADDLTNLEEYNLGYDPTTPHSGGSTASDGDKDLDGDLLSNIAELRHYGTDPANAHTYPPLTDAEYKTTGRTDGDSAVYLAGPYFPGGNQIQFILIGQMRPPRGTFTSGRT